MTELKKLRAEKPTIRWKTSLPLISRLLMFKGVREIDKTLDDFIRRLEHLEGSGSNQKIMEVVQHTILQLNEIDEKRQEMALKICLRSICKKGFSYKMCYFLMTALDGSNLTALNL